MMKSKFFSMQDIAALCLQYMDPWQAVTAIAVAWAESGGNAYAINLNDSDPTARSYLSLDKGLWQTNSYWHPEVSDRAAFDPALQLPFVLNIARKVGPYGYVYYVWTAWATFNAGAHHKFITPAVQAVRAAGGNI